MTETGFEDRRKMSHINPRRDRSSGPDRIQSRNGVADKAVTPALPNGVAKRLDLGAMFEGCEYRLPQVADNFRRRVDEYGVDECWPWTRHVGAGGYGEHKFMLAGQRRVFRAHRFAYALAHREHPIVEGVQVRHRCREKLCCNPAHLYLADRHGHPLAAGGNGLGDFEALLLHP